MYNLFSMTEFSVGNLTQLDRDTPNGHNETLMPIKISLLK